MSWRRCGEGESNLRPLCACVGACSIVNVRADIHRGLVGGDDRIALGRIVMTVPTSYFGERIASIGFLTLAMSGLTVLWQVGNLAADTAAVVLTGVCLGPGRSPAYEGAVSLKQSYSY